MKPIRIRIIPYQRLAADWYARRWLSCCGITFWRH